MANRKRIGAKKARKFLKKGGIVSLKGKVLKEIA